MRIDSSGKVGIGITSIASSTRLALSESSGNAQTLEIIAANSGGVGSQPGIKFTANNGDNIGGIFGDVNSDAVYLQTGGTPRITVDSSGRVLIGLTSPSQTHPLQIVADSNAQAIAVIGRSSDDIGEIAYWENDKTTKLGELQFRQTECNFRCRTGHIAFATGGTTERGRFTASGSFIMPGGSESLPVVGTEKIGVNGGSASNSVGIAASVSHNEGIPFFASNSSNSFSDRLMRFAAGSGGDTRGTITFNGSAMVYGGSSDYRLKKNVTSLTNGITKLKKFNPILFDWIKETDNNNVMGFLAHEVKEIMPQVVTGEKDEVDSEGNPEYQEIDLGGMSPLIVAALQEAVTKIETLETKVAALEAA